VALAGCGDDAPSKPAAAATPPAGTFAVDGHRMYIACKGTGSPTVILDSGLGVDSTSTWAAVRPKVADLTRVCIYDRAGMASSEPGPKPRTIARMTPSCTSCSPRHGLSRRTSSPARRSAA